MSADRTSFERNKKKLIAGAIVAVLIVGVVFVLFFSGMNKEEELQRATMDDLLNSSSVRSQEVPGAALVDKDRPYLVLTATPVVCYYEGPQRVCSPLLCVGENPDTPEEGSSKAIDSFLSAYGPNNVIGLGEVYGQSVDKQYIDECPMVVSTEVARDHWKSSDGALLIRYDQAGYNLGINAVPLACYLNIPIIITYTQPPEVDDLLSDLGVKYTLLCGDLRGYGKIWPFQDKEEIQAVMATGSPDSEGVLRSILTDRLGINTSYVAMANPMDIFVPTVVDQFQENFTGTVKHSDTGSTSFPTSSADAPTFYVDIPEDYKYARVILDSVMDCVPPRNFGTPQSHGERSYVYFGIDSDQDGQMVHDADASGDTLHFMSPSLAYSYSGSGGDVKAVCHTDYPIFNSTGEKCIQIKASLDYKIITDSHIPGPGIIEEVIGSETTFTLSITIQKLDSYVYPRLTSGSSLAPYLAAFRGGVVLADSKYGVHDAEMALNWNFGDPAVNKDLYKSINLRTVKAKTDLNFLLGDLAGIDGSDWSSLASAYASRDPSDPMYVGIVGDPFMVPWMYFENGQGDYGESEGFGTPSDNGYGDIDMDPENLPKSIDGGPPSLELAVGRMTGWDIQDTSSQMARTFFYDNIVDHYPGHSGSFKESAMSTHGTVVPVGAAETVVKKLQAAYQQAGFSVDANHNFALSDSKYSAQYYEQSSFIFECAHGHYYWFVPPGYKDTSAGGGFTVANVQDMNFGPGTLFASSCVTGKVDGIPLYNGLSQAFIHSGLNCYVGASRLSWGSLVPSPMASPSGEALGGYLGLLFYGYLTGYVYDRNGGLQSEGIGDLSVGAALMMAKNDFITEQGSDGGGPDDDTAEEFNLHGDPAFNPYEPIHQG